MKKINIISIGFVVLVASFSLAMDYFENSTFILGIFCLVMYFFYSHFIGTRQKNFLNVKKALQTNSVTNEELAEVTNIDPNKINLLREENDFTEEEIERLAEALGVRQEKTAARKIIFVVVGVILVVVLVYFLFGEW